MSFKEKLSGNVLTAQELLESKGIKCKAWNEYERSNQILPKSGKKQFEPDGSPLQNIQIEKGLLNRKKLLNVERVERASQLAIAEWLPVQKKAQVKKYSGQDWSNFGLEKNGLLYLIPEEALFLLEINSLELLWNDMPLSIQQAYELLIDNVECSIEEYRVYNQLARYGYHIQRYIYDYTEKEELSTKRKVIIEPENAMRGSGVNDSVGFEGNESNSEIAKQIDTKQKRNSKVKVISEETLTANIKVVRLEGNSDSFDSDDGASNPKKSRMEIVELSDDEIEEVPKPVTKMDLLNLLPNIASGEHVRVKISKKYIPSNIKPEKVVYEYHTAKFRKPSESGKFEPKPSTSNNTLTQTVIPYQSRDLEIQAHALNIWIAFQRRLAFKYNPIQNPLVFNPPPRMLPLIYPWQTSYNQNRNTYPSNYLQRGNGKVQSRSNDEVYPCSFKIIPGLSSWSELKSKWREERTITIDDDNTVELDNEVQVVGQRTSPLVSQPARTLEEVIESLSIIKTAPEKLVRRKRGRYKISYNVYSNSRHYTKSNPGVPLYRVVITRPRDDQFIQSNELQRLQRDAQEAPLLIACVSTSISYIQPGCVSLPNILVDK